MINAVYRLVAPRMIEVTYKELELTGENMILRPVKMSVCKADQRYYQGARSQAVLKQKLPMALIHECVARVVYDPSGSFRPGDMVIPVPTLPADEDEVIGENYRPGVFLSSGADGFLQDLISHPVDRTVLLPGSVTNLNVASFTELVSVGVQAVRRYERIAHSRRERVGIWGDGNVGFITALVFHSLHPETKLYVFGTVEEKLAYFSFAEKTFHVDHVEPGVRVDHAFECVGGAGSESAINQMIDLVEPEGLLMLMGVSENFVRVNTRMVLEKGLRLAGSSRSSRADFETAVGLMAKDRNFIDGLDKLVGDVVSVSSIPDIHRAFDLDFHRSLGKTVINWVK